MSSSRVSYVKRNFFGRTIYTPIFVVVALIILEKRRRAPGRKTDPKGLSEFYYHRWFGLLVVIVVHIFERTLYLAPNRDNVWSQTLLLALLTRSLLKNTMLQRPMCAREMVEQWSMQRRI